MHVVFFVGRILFIVIKYVNIAPTI